MERAGPEAVGLSSERLKRLDRKMQAYVDAGEFAGITTAIARRGKLAHLGLHGLADIESGRPMAEDTIFRIHSLTKPITAVAALMLYEEGHFLLGDPVSRFIPSFKEMKVLAPDSAEGELVDAQPEIQIRHLLSHTSGLRYGWYPDRSEVDRRLVDVLREVPAGDRGDLGAFVDVLATVPLA